MCPCKLGRLVIFHKSRLKLVRVVPNYPGSSLKIYFSYKPIYCTALKSKPYCALCFTWTILVP